MHLLETIKLPQLRSKLHKLLTYSDMTYKDLDVQK